MRSISDILNLIVDDVVTTPAAAAAIIEEEVAARIRVCSLTEPEARKNLLDAIGFATAYMSVENADKTMTLFNTQHPLWGRTHPTPEEAMRLGEEDAARRLHKEND